ncbi:hypothetical protein ACFWFX_15035, partial [Streptomyces roseolus]|uniref:hypothetical protein n=1 Tax=Streptomyces roseolus TaxID=67358 RepID=UPI003654FED3
HTDLFTHRASESPVRAEPVTFEAPASVDMPLFLPPDATAAEETRKRRRAERAPKKIEEPGRVGRVRGVQLGEVAT